MLNNALSNPSCQWGTFLADMGGYNRPGRIRTCWDRA